MGQVDIRENHLLKFCGREMVLRVADICSKVVENSNLFIATDSKKIKKLWKNQIIK